MNLQINKICSHCVKGVGEYVNHAYTVYDKLGLPVQIENCGFIRCNFCGVQQPDAPTVAKLGELRERGEIK